MSSGSAPSSHGLTTPTTCSAICAGPGPGLDRKALPSMPSSVWIRSTPRGTGRAGPKLAEAVCLRSCRTTVMSVMRTIPDVTRLAAERQGPCGARVSRVNSAQADRRQPVLGGGGVVLLVDADLADQLQ